MLNTLALCRQQEAYHRQLAADAPLDNVRQIALIAAAAWALEADAIETQGTKEGGKLSKADAAIALEFRLEEEIEEQDRQPG
ncbi:hypothetical protein [Aquisediminimonas sediminicola]|uniref:hypothetical protein n=1 Tax=Alteraquisediminimonas sediminicola TaxID=2676787 RepID=UPI001C8E5CDB|nr:hypothetical protein [Aquisediminimonas sediminicola]